MNFFIASSLTYLKMISQRFHKQPQQTLKHLYNNLKFSSRQDNNKKTSSHNVAITIMPSQHYFHWFVFRRKKGTSYITTHNFNLRRPGRIVRILQPGNNTFASSFELSRKPTQIRKLIYTNVTRTELLRTAFVRSNRFNQTESIESSFLQKQT